MPRIPAEEGDPVQRKVAHVRAHVQRDFREAVSRRRSALMKKSRRHEALFGSESGTAPGFSRLPPADKARSRTRGGRSVPGDRRELDGCIQKPMQYGQFFVLRCEA